MSSKNNIQIIIVACLIFFSGCENPFFPKTGSPNSTNNGPIRAILQLKRSYIDQRLDLFEDALYSEEEFRFYVEHNDNYYDSLENINLNQFEEISIDNKFNIIRNFVAPDSTYIYLTYNEEVNIHKELFLKAKEIIFGSFNPIIEYEDSTDAIVSTNSTVITIKSDLFQNYANSEIAFRIGPQIFFLRKDNGNAWKIRLWFELDDYI